MRKSVVGGSLLIEGTVRLLKAMFESVLLLDSQS